MEELIGNLWDYHAQGYSVCITTNGFVKKNGDAVMGRGVARQARDRFPEIAAILGMNIQAFGWRAVLELVPGVWNFPVKPDGGLANLFGTNVISRLRETVAPGVFVPGWALKADPAIIKKSLAMLYEIKRERHIHRFILPRPGCGTGELDWKTQVRPLCKVYGNWLSVISLK